MAKTLVLGTKTKVVKFTSKAVTKLVDELGAAHEQRKLFEAEERQLKEQLKKLGAGVYDGRLFCATSEEVVKTTLKTALLREHVNAELLKRCEVKSAYLEINLVRR
jgi:hypothetical protein